ncbi:TonB-dependent receptor, partial [Sphingosinicella xenopeptidilytica]
MRFSVILAASTAPLAFASLPAAAADVEPDSAFTLGQIIVTAPEQEGIAIASSTLSSEAIYTFNRNTLDEAVSLMPG